MGMSPLLTGALHLQAYMVIKTMDNYGNAVPASMTTDSVSGFRTEISGAEVTLTPHTHIKCTFCLNA